MRCRICNNKNLKEFLSLGRSPLANKILAKEDLLSKEPTFPLELCFCAACGLVQLRHVVPPELMFREYPYVSSTTETFKEHFAKMAADVARISEARPGDLVVDIGSNDGLLLKSFQQMGMRVVGVEPASNIASLAIRDGIETVNDFFSEEVVKKIVQGKGKADIVTATNVFTHIDDIHAFARLVKDLMKRDGILVLEVYYLLSILENISFDMVYHEHLSYFTASTLDKFFRLMGMTVFRIEKVGSHGGSLRAYVQIQGGRFKVEESVGDFLATEVKAGMLEFQTYENFAKKIMKVRSDMLSFLDKAMAEGKRVVGYGAPAKATTLLCFCGVGPDKISYIVDENPLKQGKYIPGVHIPVVPPQILDRDVPDYVLILAWNFVDEILRKTQRFRSKETRFFIPIPKLTELGV
jgi:hypothetical protein